MCVEIGGVVVCCVLSSAVGQFNEANRVGTLFVVGSGESEETRANAFEVSASGALVNGDLEVSGSINIGGENLLQKIAALEDEFKELGNNIGMGAMGFVGKSMVIDCNIEVCL